MTVESSALAGRFYANVSSALNPGPAPAAAEGRGASDAFGDMARSFLETLQSGETTAEKGLAGKADMQSVVSALSSTEMAVQTAVTLRDQVVKAYQEILRMPV